MPSNERHLLTICNAKRRINLCHSKHVYKVYGGVVGQPGSQRVEMASYRNPDFAGATKKSSAPCLEH